MSELLTKLGIDWKLLIAQMVNFFILLWVLKRFAYKPILNALERRSKKIEKSLEDAKRIELELSMLERNKERIMGEARVEAHKIIQESRDEAAQFTNRNREQTQEQAAALIASAQKEIARMKESIVAEARTELADLVVTSAEKIIRVRLDDATQRKLLEQVLQEKSVGGRDESV